MSISKRSFGYQQTHKLIFVSKRFHDSFIIFYFRLIFYLLIHKICKYKKFYFNFEAISTEICSQILIETKFVVTQFDEVPELKDLFMEQSKSNLLILMLYIF